MNHPLTAYAARVLELEAEGMTTSDAQGIADIENLDDTVAIHEPATLTEQAIVDILAPGLRVADAPPAREVLVELRDVFGTAKVYPANVTAGAFADLCGTLTLTPRTLRAVAALGFTIREIHGRLVEY